MKITPSLKIILTIFLCACLLPTVYAQVTDELVNYLCEYAQRLYAQGDLEGAKHEFRKALMVNPGNATAKRYLKTMGVGADNESYSINREALGPESIDKEQISALQKSLDVKNKELADLKRGQELERVLSDRAQSAQVQKLTFDKEAQIRKLENQVKTLDTFIANELAQYKNKREALEISLQAKDKEITGLNENLKLQREQLFSKDNILRNLNNTLQAKDKELTDINNALKLQEGQLTRKDAVIQDKDNQIADRENALGARDNQIQDFKSQISAQELEKQMIMDAGKSPLNQLVEYKAKLDSMEDALGAKEKEITGLNENLNLQREQLAGKDSVLAAKDNQIARLNDELANQAKNQESIVKNAEVLDAGLGEAKNRIAQAEKSTLDKDMELNALTGRLKELDAQLAEDKNKLAQAEKSALDKSNELSSRLTEAERLTLDKDKQIKALQEQLSQLASSYAAQLAEGQDKAFKLRNILRLKDKKLKALKKETDTASQVAQLKDTMEKLKKSLQTEIETYKAKLESAKKGIVVTVLADILFNSGSAEITSGGRDILSKISAGLKSLPADYQIVIEGHTDNEPIGYSGWKSNWELSTGRALSVLHYLVGKCGLNEEVFSVSGYGELRPVADNATERGQRQNRRVEIVINPPKVIKVKASELTE